MHVEKLTGETITSWWRAHDVADEMRWKGAAGRQLGFVLDVLPRAWCETGAEYRYHGEEGGALVVATHTSKSILLPVYQIDIPRLGFVAMLRDNFHDWKVSLRAERPVAIDPAGLFDPADARSILGVYCEGFPDAWVFGPYARDPRRFTASVRDEHRLYTLFHLLARGGGMR